MNDVVTIVEGLDFVVSLAEGHVHPEDLYSARTVADRARTKAGHLGSTLVLALVGGTGSGKSSLLNAVAGAPVASTSEVRPHTTEPLAWIPEDAEPSLGLLLDRLGVEQRVSQSTYPSLAILDMTDIDSIEPDHRHRVERLLPEVDVVVWVLDPVKYAEPGLHRDFVVPLAGSADRLVFVLNKIDRLDDANRTRIHTDLHHLLGVDGIARPVIFEVAADPDDGDPRGIEALTVHLTERLDDKQVQIGKIIDEARQSARAIAGAAGVTAGGSLEFEQRWREVRRAITSEILSGRDTAGFEEALRLLESLVLRLATEAGGGFGLRIRYAFPTGRIEAELRASVDAAGGTTTPGDILDRELQERFGAPIRTILWERSSLAAVLTGLAVDAAALDAGLGRPAQ